MTDEIIRFPAKGDKHDANRVGDPSPDSPSARRELRQLREQERRRQQARDLAEIDAKEIIMGLVADLMATLERRELGDEASKVVLVEVLEHLIRADGIESVQEVADDVISRWWGVRND